jgi:hypothetical protein
MNFVTAVVSGRVVIPSQLTSVVVTELPSSEFLEFRPGSGQVPADGIICTRGCSGHSSFFTRLFPMAPQQNQLQVPNFRLRILIIGRANAGKTTILARVCDTTESPKVYRLDQSGQRSEVCPRS